MDQQDAGKKNKPELVATAGTLEEVSRLLEAGADALQAGEETYGMRLPGSMALPELREAAALAHERGARLYAVVNKIMLNADLDKLPAYLAGLQESGADAIVFGDPSVLLARKQAGVTLPLHWNPEMTATNWVTANYWGTKGATRVITARELNMEQILEIKQRVSLEVQVQVHGMTNIFHSKRSMVSNYRKHTGHDPAEESLDEERGLYLVEAERQDERYPIYEDANGTHIMSADDLCMIENLAELMEAGIDSFKIEGLLKPIGYNETVVRAYREAIDAYAADPEGYEFREEWLDRIKRVQPVDRELSYGFFYKEQVY
ncbi:putative protease YrrN [Paenibacillus sp. J31TS4]|uniref:peptidase U32 family protein n=1 Tax=Paenibacillus sp. J31TS4 TaxID=2807195 RepID=UPI001B23A5A2|nr:peptidase U32 family protein [Paenibacillus sp. J31TS4]GIP39261.1 putative protease YrrN [Paenibacillus sp. J31TS4]